MGYLKRLDRNVKEDVKALNGISSNINDSHTQHGVLECLQHSM